MRRQILQRASHSSQVLLRNSQGRPSIAQQLQTSTSPRSLSNLPQQTQLRPSFFQHNTPSRWNAASIGSRSASTSKSLAESQHGSKGQSYKEEMKDKTFDPDEQDEEEPGFARSEKAAQASQLNLSARLSKDGTPGGTFIIILWLSIVLHCSYENYKQQLYPENLC